MNKKLSDILDEILDERKRQDSMWGGPEHDDTHNMDDWTDFIDHEMDQINLRNDRKQLIKIAALAIAAIESLDRQ